MPSSAPRIRPRVCGQERSQRNDCPLQGKLQGREFLWSSPFLPFYFSDSSLRKTICLSAMSGVFPIASAVRLQPAICHRQLLCSAQEPCHLSRQGESSMASHFNKLATVFTLQVLGLGSLIFPEIPRILMFFQVGGF